MQKSPTVAKVSRLDSTGVATNLAVTPLKNEAEFKAPVGLPPRSVAKKPDRLDFVTPIKREAVAESQSPTVPAAIQLPSPVRQSKIVELEMLKTQLREKARQKVSQTVKLLPV